MNHNFIQLNTFCGQYAAENFESVGAFPVYIKREFVSRISQIFFGKLNKTYI